MIAGLPVCHPPTKSSPSRPTTVLSDLIMSRIKSREEEKGGPTRASRDSQVTHIKSASTFFENTVPFCYRSIQQIISISNSMPPPPPFDVYRLNNNVARIVDWCELACIFYFHTSPNDCIFTFRGLHLQGQMETCKKKKKKYRKKPPHGLVRETEQCNHSGGPKHAEGEGDKRNKQP